MFPLSFILLFTSDRPTESPLFPSFHSSLFFTPPSHSSLSYVLTKGYNKREFFSVVSFQSLSLSKDSPLFFALKERERERQRERDKSKVYLVGINNNFSRFWYITTNLCVLSSIPLSGVSSIHSLFLSLSLPQLTLSQQFVTRVESFFPPSFINFFMTSG